MALQPVCPDAVLTCVTPPLLPTLGDKIKQVLLGSKLATPKLEKIWALADVDKDGKMDIEEFSVRILLPCGLFDRPFVQIAMKLSFALINNDIQDLPAVLPAELIPAKTTAVAAGSVSPPFAVSPLPGQAVPAEGIAQTQFNKGTNCVLFFFCQSHGRRLPPTVKSSRLYSKRLPMDGRV